MKKLWAYFCAAAVLLCSCAQKEQPQQDTDDAAASMTGEMVIAAPEEGFDMNYANCIRDYFEAIEQKQFEGYQKTVYPPYQEAFGAYLKSSDSSLEEVFHTLCTEFDEDGYDSWHLTRLEVGYRENEDIDNFFSTYESAGLFDAEFSDAAREDAAEIRDVEFTLYALYEGDEEAVPVVQKQEMIVIRTKDDKYYLFG